MRPLQLVFEEFAALLLVLCRTSIFAARFPAWFQPHEQIREEAPLWRKLCPRKVFAHPPPRALIHFLDAAIDRGIEQKLGIEIVGEHHDWIFREMRRHGAILE